MKPIAYILGTFPNLTETFIVGEIQAIRDLGVEIQVFALRPPKSTSQSLQATSLGAKTYYRPSFFSWNMWGSNLRALWRSPGRYFNTLARLLAWTGMNPVHCLKSLGLFPVAAAFAEAIRERGIRHIHAHWATYPTTMAYIISRLLDIPYSFTAHAYDATLIRAMMKEKVRRAAFIVTCTHQNRQLLSALLPEATAKIMVSYHGVFLDRFAPAGKPVSQGRDKLVIVSCGSLYPRKGFPDLLEACRLLRDKGVKFHCMIIGEGPLRPRLERSIRSHGLDGYVHMHGAVPHEEVARHYRTADLFVLPCVTHYLGWGELFTNPVLLLEVGLAIPFRSIMDGIPNVLVEAMATGIPVISTWTSAIPELVRDEWNGLLVPPHDPVRLVQAIERLLLDPALRQFLGRNAVADARARFDRRKNIETLAVIFSRLTAGSTHIEQGQPL